MMTFETNDPSNCGIVKKNKNQCSYKVLRKENENYGNEANGAVYILSKEFQKFF